MSTWIAITADQLNDYSVAAKVNALRTAALKSGQADPFEAVMPDVVSMMRMQIRSAGYSVSATVNSIPPEIKTHACWLIIQALQARLPGLKLTDEEKEMVKKADSYMNKVAMGDYSVSTPDDPISTDPVQSFADPGYGGATKLAMRTDAAT